MNRDSRRLHLSFLALVGAAMAVMFCLTPAVSDAAIHHERNASVRNVGAPQSWTPSEAPFPQTSPYGSSPFALSLAATSCSSSSFCVSVGTVDYSSGQAPLAEIRTGTKWTPTVLPVPANGLSQGNFVMNTWLTSVSCPTDGNCAIAGGYDAYNPVSNNAGQFALLYVLSGGTWSVQEGPVPAGAWENLMYSVSCSDPSDCYAVGLASMALDSVGVVDTWNGSTWSVQTLPTPSAPNLDVNSITCQLDNTCVAVGDVSSSASTMSNGVIWTLVAGSWSWQVAPLPANAATTQLPGKSPPGEKLSAVDCPEVNSCLAVGFYVDSNYNTQPLLVTGGQGAWTANGAAVPPDSQSNTLSGLTGVFCAAANACTATGWYFKNYLANDESGMILTQGASGWSVISAPLPTGGPLASRRSIARSRSGPSVSNASGRALTSNAAATGVSLNGVSCADGDSCVAVGNDAATGLVEAGTSTVPSVSSISPSSGPVSGGTLVTITGTNFTSASAVSFGGTPAGNTKFISSGELQAVSPSVAHPQYSSVGVSDLGVLSRSSERSAFLFGGPELSLSSASRTALVRVSGSYWYLKDDTSVGLYQCASATFAVGSCDVGNAISAAVKKSGVFKTVKMQLVVGSVDSAGDSCGLSTSATCFVVAVGNTGDSVAAPIAFAKHR